LKIVYPNKEIENLLVAVLHYLKIP